MARSCLSSSTRGGRDDLLISRGFGRGIAATTRFDSSPLAGFTDSNLGKTSFYWTAGVLAPAAGNAWVAFDVGENYGSSAGVPDFSLHLQLGFRFPPSR